MSLNLSQFKSLIVQPALSLINASNPVAINLVTGTALAESNLIHLRQLPDGPALGLFQMEPATHEDCWENFLKFRPALAGQIADLAGKSRPLPEMMMGNLYYAAAMCRVKYLRAASPLPANQASALSVYHKQIYNTAGGAADAGRNTALFQKAIEA